MHGRLITSVICSAALLGPVAGAAQASECAGADLPTSSATALQVSTATLCLLNEQRAAAGVPALKLETGLGRVARRYARDMATRHFFSHESPSGQTLSDRISTLDYEVDAAGENLAVAGGTVVTPAAIVSAWMGSSGHRANVLDRDYKRVG